MDLTFVDSQIYPVVRDKITEALDDVAHFYHGRIHVHMFF